MFGNEWLIIIKHLFNYTRKMYNIYSFIYLLNFSYLYLVGVIKEVFDCMRNHGMEHLKNKWFLSLLERLHSTINTLTVQLFTSNRHFTFTTDVPNLTTLRLLLFVESQFTTNAQKSSTKINAQMDTSHHGLSQTFRISGAVRMVWETVVFGWWSVSSFPFWAEYAGIFKFPHL
jgi:hypothetical protein